MAATTKLAEIDAILVRYADTLSAEAISYKIDGILTPRQVMQRIDQLVEVPDRLTMLQQDQLVTLKMRQIVVELEELPRTTRNAEVMLSGLEKIGVRLDKRTEATEKELKSLYAFQGTVLLDAVEIAMAHMRNALTQGNPVAEAQWDDAKESALRFAQIELSRHDIDRDEDADANMATLPELDAVVVVSSSSDLADEVEAERDRDDNRREELIRAREAEKRAAQVGEPVYKPDPMMPDEDDTDA